MASTGMRRPRLISSALLGEGAISPCRRVLIEVGLDQTRPSTCAKNVAANVVASARLGYRMRETSSR